jgi:hypothetical protein
MCPPFYCLSFQLIGFIRDPKGRRHLEEVTISLHLTDIRKTIAFSDTRVFGDSGTSEVPSRRSEF